jgi:hypothetical protein
MMEERFLRGGSWNDQLLCSTGTENKNGEIPRRRRYVMQLETILF